MKKKIFSILFALVLVCSFSLVTAVPAGANGPDEVWVDLNFARDINGVLSPGEWGTPLCTETGTYQTITVYAHATMDALYLAFDTGDMTDNRGVSTLDVLDWNIGLVGSDFNPAWCGPEGVPWRYALRTKVEVDNSWGDSWDAIDGYHGCWEDTWNPNPADPGTSYYHIPGGIEMVTSFGTGHRVTEFKVPMSLMFDGTHGWDGPNAGDVLLLGGTFSGEDAGANFEMLWWPPGIDHCTEGTYATIEVEGRPSTPLGGHTFGFDAFVTIQGGIGAVGDGGTVNVAAGTYNEHIINQFAPYNKSFDLIGAGADVVTWTAPSGEYPLQIDQQSGVSYEVSGFTFIGDGAHPIKTAGGGFTDLDIHDNVFENAALDLNHCDTGAVLRGLFMCRSIASRDVDGVSSIRVHDNVFNTEGGICMSNTKSFDIYDNEFNVLCEGIYSAAGCCCAGWTIGDHHIYGNTFSGISGDAINLDYWNDGFTYLASTIEWNNFEGTGGYAVNVTTDRVTENATNNWWDDATGPIHASNSGGAGDPVSDNVDFSPWFGDPVGTDPMTIVYLVTGYDTGPVPINGIATVGITGGDASQGTIGGTSGHPDEPSISLFDGTGKTSVLSLDIKVTGYTSGMALITVPYPDDPPPGDGIVDDTTVVETTLGLYYFDDDADMWHIAGNNTVDTALNTVSGVIPVSALTGTPLGLGGYEDDEATVAIGSKSVDYSGNDTVALTITTQTAQLGAATIDVTFDNTVVEVLGGENSDFDSLTVNPLFDVGKARFVASQLGLAPAGGAVLAQVRLKAVGTVGSSSPLTLDVITLKDNHGIAIPIGIVTDGTATIGGLGDANSDGRVNVFDCVYIARAIAGFHTTSLGAMDVDGSGVVDAFDCTYLARHLAGIPGYPLGG